MQSKFEDLSRSSDRIDLYKNGEMHTLRDGDVLVFDGDDQYMSIRPGDAYVFAGAPENNPHGMYKLVPCVGPGSVVVNRGTLADQLISGQWDIPALD